jgi:alpha-beta hydrolase superfamily lysophospholipase
VSVRLLLTALAAVLAGCDASRLMLFPDEARLALERRPVDPRALGYAPRVVEVENSLGQRVRGWLFESPRDRGLALVANGNGTALPHAFDYNRFLIGRGARVLVFSYQGYDDNPGEASLRSLVGDWAAFHAWGRRAWPDEPVVFVGESIGAAAALCAAVGAESAGPDGLVLEAVPDLKRLPYARLLQMWPLWPLLPVTLPLAAAVSAGVPAALDPPRCAARSTIPALFVHHPLDPVTPVAHTRRIFARYAGPKTLLLSDLAELPTYHLILAADDAVRERVARFVEERLGAR